MIFKNSKASFLTTFNSLLVALSLVSCNGAEFVGSSRSDSKLKARTAGTAEIKASTPTELMFDFQLPLSEAQETIQFSDVVTNLKNLTLSANYIQTSKKSYAVYSGQQVTAKNDDGLVRRIFRRFYDFKSVDIVLVVDNSSAMGPEQQKLAQAMLKFKSDLTDMDWRILVTSSDVSVPCSIKILDKNSTDKELSDSVMLGENGSDMEAPLFQAGNILNGNCPAAKIRDQAKPAVFIVTNEDECSTGAAANCPTVAGKSAGILIDFPQRVDNTPGMSRNDITVGLIGWLPTQLSCPTGISKAATLSKNLSGGYYPQGGVQGSICDSSFTATVTDFIGKIRAASDPFTVSISSLSPASAGALVLDSQKVIFSDGTTATKSDVTMQQTQPLQLSLTKKPEFFGKKGRYEVTVSDVPRSKIVKWGGPICDPGVAYTGQLWLQNRNTMANALPATYQLRTAQCEIEFEQPLTFPFLLTIQTKVAILPVTKFDLGANVVTGSVVVETYPKLTPSIRTPITDFTVDASGILTLATPIVDTTLEAVVTYKVLNDPIFRFDIALPSRVQDIVVKDSSNGALIQFQKDGPAIVLDRSEIKDGRKIEISYKSTVEFGRVLKLGHTPSDLSQLLAAISSQCRMVSGTNIFSPVDNSIDLSQCDPALSSFGVSYKYFEPQTRYELPLSDAELANIIKIEVTNNGVVFEGFEMDGKFFVIKSAVKPGDIKVKVTLKS